jgi:hypothetical protein
MEVVRETEELLGKNEAYEAIYLEYRKYVDTEVQKIKEQNKRLSKEGRAILAVPILDELGLDTLEKINVEAELIRGNISDLPSRGRQAVFRICAIIVSQYQILINKKLNAEDTNAESLNMVTE